MIDKKEIKDMEENELKKALTRALKLLDERQEHIDFLEEQVKEIKEMFEKAGSDKSKYEHENVRLRDRLEKYEGE